MRNRWVIILLLCVSLLFPLRASASGLPEPLFQESEIAPGQLIVIMEPGSSLRALSLPDQSRASAKKRPGLEKINAQIIEVPAGSEAEYIAKLRRQEGVLAVEPNYIVRAELIPNDTSYSSQYGPALIQSEAAWDVTTGSNSVTIAIIDSGLDESHPEFAGRIAAGYDFVQDDLIPQDEFGHGTHVAGIAAATGNNTTGIAGINWGVSIMPLRVLDRYGNGFYSDVADALIRAADQGAKVINLSLGGPAPSITLESAIDYAYSRGAAIFAASGNSGGAVLYPAAYPRVMAVGWLNSAAVRSPSSNYGPELDLMAPGEAIYSTLPMSAGFYYNLPPISKSTQYDTLSGTSMASPHAAGAASLLASLPCFDTPEKIYRALMDTARDLGSPGWDQLYGHGLIQTADAMSMCSTLPGTPFDIEYDLVTSDNCNPLIQYNWRDASSGTALSALGDSGSALVSLPFTFNFGGQDYASVRIHANGFISLGNKNTDTTDGNFRSNAPLPTTLKPDNFIAPFWDDLADNGGAGRIHTATLGLTPSREFVIEYRGVGRSSGSPGNLNFEVILFETSDNIEMQYRSLSGPYSDGSSATVGLEYGNIVSGFAAYEYSHNLAGALEDGLALLFVPYAGGAPTLPSHVVCPQKEAVTIESGVASACATSPGTFDVDIESGDLLHRSVLKVQQVFTAPSLPASFVDLQHYADINLSYSPPLSTLSLPPVDVCYEYTPQDLLAAGGHPENLFIAAHDRYSNQWQRLPTTVDLPNSRLFARAPHFSYYGVATLDPSGGTSGGFDGLGLPVTGTPFSRELAVLLSLLFGVLLFVTGGLWIKTRRR